MVIYAAVMLFISHYVGDFLLQRRAVALNKSRNMRYLIEHVLIIFIVTTAAMLVFGKPFFITIIASTMYSLLHGVQDKIVWRGFNDLVIDNELAKNDTEFDNWFFRFLGLDQMVHMIVLFVISYVFLV